MRGLKNDKNLVHLATLPRSAPDFFDDLEQLQPYLKSGEPLFVLLRRHHGRGPPLVGVMYTPDDCEQFLKMTFSGTCTALYRDLGEEHFSKKYQLHSASDLTPSGFRAQEKYDEEPGPLTEKEKELAAVKEQEAAAHTGTRGRPLASGSGPKLDITDAAAIKALEKFARGDNSFFMLVGSLWYPYIYILHTVLCGKLTNVSLRLVQRFTNVDKEQKIEFAPSSLNPTSLDEAVNAIAIEEPRYTFYRWKLSREGVQDKDFVLFFYTFPAEAKGMAEQVLRFSFAQLKASMQQEARSRFGISVDASFESQYPKDITEDDVLHALEKNGVNTGGAGTGARTKTETETETETQTEPRPIAGLASLTSSKRHIAAQRRKIAGGNK